MIQMLYKPFQKWSEKGSVYLIGDTHFDDPDREFMGYNISEKEQIDTLKSFCHKNDTLIHLGDVGNPEYMNQLKCYKVLIMGNHDKSKTNMEQYFDEVYEGPLWIAPKIVLSHEPIRITLGFWDEICFNIHGHDHSGWEIGSKDNHLNLAQNVAGYLPYNLKNIIKDGTIKQISDIHRVTIDNASLRKTVDKLAETHEEYLISKEDLITALELEEEKHE